MSLVSLPISGGRSVSWLRARDRCLRPVRVSKALARKVRNLTLGGDLDWVVGDGLRKEDSDPVAEPWTALLWRYPGEFTAAVAAYKGELEFEVQA